LVERGVGVSIDRMTEDEANSPSAVGRLESACDRFEDAWRGDDRPSLEEFWEPRVDSTDLLRELLVLELAYRVRLGEHPRPDEYLARFPGHEAMIKDAVAAVKDRKGISTLSPRTPESVHAVDATTSPDDLSCGVAVEHHVVDALSRVGYEVIGELGRGGMGIVYEARQVALGRVVAIKVLKSGLFATEDECRRFLNEAEAVAHLDHPAIVPIFEVRRSRGLYFYSMRRVGGCSLDERLKRGPLNPQDAARLVGRIAVAVDVAHRHGILHRDIKPANILVDEAGAPFLTDFGLARRLDGEGSDATRTGAVVGTPAYMAPEQVEGKFSDLTTATDVFGLGGVLYAALTAHAPHTGSSVADTLDRVRKVTPEAPSRINRLVPRDLESVCLKCLEKDPRRRYASAREIADDLDRWIAGKPTLARPVSVLTRSRMWARRHPLPAALVSALVAAVLLGLAGIGWQWREANRQRHHAERLLDYLSNRLLAQASTEVNPQGANVTVREILDRQTSRIGGEFQDEPEIEARLRETIGTTYHSLGLFEPAEQQLRLALDLIDRTEGASSSASIRIATRLGRVIGDRGGLSEGERLLSRTSEAAVQALGPDDPATLEATARLGIVYLAQHRTEEAELLFRRVLKARRRVLPTDHPDTLKSVSDLCRLAVETEQFDVAEPLAYEYEHGIRCARGPNHPDNVTALTNRSLICRLRGKIAEAKSFQEKAVQEAKRILGPTHPVTTAAEREFAVLLENLDKSAPRRSSGTGWKDFGN
jgi:tetratricopeptide (TPR) repeat protein